MKLKDEILAELRNGTPIAEIRRNFRSQSQLYEAIREFLEKADEIVEETRDRLAKGDLALTEARAELDSVNREKEQVSVEVQELVDAKEKLSGEVRDNAEELAVLSADLQELQARGFTSEIVKEIKAVQDRWGPDLLREVKTVEKHRQLAKEVSGFSKEKTKLTRMVKDLETKRRKMREELVSEKNRLDELMVQTATYKDAVDMVHFLFSEGYSSQDVESLKHGLDMLGIKGDPLLSVRRLVEGLSKQKGLASLNENVIAKRQELTTLDGELAVTVGRLEAEKEGTLKAIEEVKLASVAAITDTAAHGNAAIKAERATAETQIRQVSREIRADLAELSKLQQQRGELKKSIEGGIAFLGILESPEVLTKVSLPLVVQLFERLRLWCEMNVHDVMIRPSREVQNKDYRFSIYNVYKVSVLVELVYEGLKQLMIKQSHGTNAAGEMSCQA